MSARPWRDSIVGLHEAVLDEVNFTTSEPAAPSVGDRYINTTTGASSGTAQAVVKWQIYEWNGANWDLEQVLTTGEETYDAAAGYEKTYQGTTLGWVQSSQTINLYGSMSPTANQTTLTDDGDGTITFGTVQDIASGSSPTFTNISIHNLMLASAARITGLTGARLVGLDASENLTDEDLSDWATGTTDQVNIADNGDGTATFSTPQDIASGSSPTFATIQITDATTAFDLIFASDSTAAFDADRTLTIDMNNVDRTLALQGNLTVETVSVINQDLTTDADVTFKDATLTGSLTIGQEMLWTGTAVAHGASPYTILATDKVLDVDVSGGAFTGNLPAATGTGRIIIFNDIEGNCNNNNITIDPNGTEHINSLGSGVAYVMTENHQCIWLRDAASTQWSIIAQY